MKNEAEILFSVLRFELSDQKIEFKREDLDAELLQKLYALSKAHDLSHLVGKALRHAGLLDAGETAKSFTKQQMLAIYRFERLNYEYLRICALFDREKIAYMPLKGAVLRKFYPEPWMRTSCDIDILVKEEQLTRALDVLSSELHYKTEGGKTFHDVHVFSESGVHLELHYNIKEDLEPMDAVLSRVWEYAYPTEQSPCRYEQTIEYLLFHLIAHAAYHFINGGCGIRFVLDLWLLKKQSAYNENLLSELLSAAELQTFARELFALADVWFEGRAHSDLTLEMEAYILGAGLYGTVENSVAMGQSGDSKGGRVGYLMRQVFMPYKNLKGRFPVLEKWPVLFPVFTVYRWFRIAFGKHRTIAVQVMRSSTSLDSAKANRLTALRKNLELSQK